MYKLAQQFIGSKKKPPPIPPKTKRGMMGIYKTTLSEIAFGRAPRDNDEIDYMYCEFEPEIVVDLTEISEWKTYMDYRPLLKREKSRGIKIDMIHFPITDMCCPKKSQIKEFMKLMDDLDKIHREKKKIYIHCKGGHGRAGLIFGCLISKLMKHKTYEEIKQTIDKIHSQRTDCEKEWLEMGSPQTTDQIDFLKRYIEYNNNIYEKQKKKLDAKKLAEDRQKQLEYNLKEYEDRILSNGFNIKTTYVFRGIPALVQVEQ